MKIAVFDVDGTLVKGSCERLFLNELIQLKIVNIKRLFQTLWYSVSNFPTKGLRAFKSNRIYYKDIPKERLTQLSKKIFNEKIKPLISKIVLEYLNELKTKGYKIVIVTGSSDILAGHIEKYVSADFLISSHLEYKEGVCTGHISGKHIYSKDKINQLNLKFKNINFKESYSFADHFSDITQLKKFGHPITVSPDIFLRIYAWIHKWKIISN